MTHIYFAAKAAQVFINADGDPRYSGPLAEWAEAHRDDPHVDGVIVADDGTLLAETWHDRDPGSAGAYYVNRASLAEHLSLDANEVGLALGSLTRQTGRAVIHVKRDSVCRGAMRFIDSDAVAYAESLPQS